MTDIISLLSQIPSFKAGLKGKNVKPQKQTLGQMGQLAEAQYNPDSPIYQKLYTQNSDSMQGDLASAISEISRQNRKLTSMGRNPLLDQERGGESVFRNLILGQQGAGQTARTDTLRQLSGGQNALSGIYRGQGDVEDENYMNRLNKASTYSSIGDALKGLFNLG